MCVLVSMCMYICVYLGVCDYVCVYVCVNVFLWVCVRIYVCTCVCMCTCVCVYVCVYVYVCLCVVSATAAMYHAQMLLLFRTKRVLLICQQQSDFLVTIIGIFILLWTILM